ncbi:hypothetical protein [Flavobacterium sp. LC2016-12]|uniref:hypothetical protein n=1 Tax=Flavobacterium sp. LC2016-12 TaxID=2783794 RepID=UPI00188C27F3|nr:hypothetical protein [Flavobacterium sp. LC2016-12]MBF4465409.1 hypothetical protein [Flavobacterium sp. LC2016-12]
MKKITQNEIENVYKEAIRKKYRSVKTEGEHSHYLNNPSQALLRDLCWEIFNSKPNEHDLIVYRNFFKSEFNSKEEDTSIPYTNKFKKVGAFLRGDKEPAKSATFELAAILVGFEDRPFYKFKKTISIGSGESEEKEELGSNISLKSDVNKEGRKEDDKIVIERENLPISFQSNIKHSFLEKLFNRSKLAMIITSVIFCLIAATIYFAFTRNKCMQWAHDHYEKVDCDLSTDEFLVNNGVEAYNENKFALKKIIVYDTTNCFKNGEAIIWYAKIGNRADFFNTHGRHPENDKPLRPVTRYILDKYAEKSNSKK